MKKIVVLAASMALLAGCTTKVYCDQKPPPPPHEHDYRGRRVRASGLEWPQRHCLAKSAVRVHAEHVDRLADVLGNLPTKIGAPILAA